MMVGGVLGCVTSMSGWVLLFAKVPHRCRLPLFPQRLVVWLSEGTGPQAPSIMADKAFATKRVGTFYFILYFGGLTPKDLIFV